MGGKTEDFMAAAKVFLASVCIMFSYCISINIMFDKGFYIIVGFSGRVLRRYCVQGYICYNI